MAGWRPVTLLKQDSGTFVFLSILQNTSKQLLLKFEANFQVNLKRIWSKFEMNKKLIWNKFEANAKWIWSRFETSYVKWIWSESDTNLKQIENQWVSWCEFIIIVLKRSEWKWIPLSFKRIMSSLKWILPKWNLETILKNIFYMCVLYKNFEKIRKQSLNTVLDIFFQSWQIPQKMPMN